jgi:two-component system sensor histidine kinase ChvG
MSLDQPATLSDLPPPEAARVKQVDGAGTDRPRRAASRRLISPLTLRVLAVNVLALALLATGLLFLDRYQLTLIDSEITNLKVEAQLISAAIGEEAVVDSELDDGPVISVNQARSLLQRMVTPVRSRAQMFGPDGRLMLDSSVVVQPGGLVTVLPLPGREDDGPLSFFTHLYDWVFNSLPRRDAYPLYYSSLLKNAASLTEGVRALEGDPAGAVYRTKEGLLVFNVAVPIQSYRQVLGVLMLSRNSADSDEALRQVRVKILTVFLGALVVTVALSLYLASTIARPIRRLAAAAERTRHGRSRVLIPDFTKRGDEIGDLSAALREMTDALWLRLEAIERFAADVAHEIKNPLTSLRSAVETAARVQDPDRQKQLLAIVLHDVQRLDRLISDISSASRLDAELARAEMARVDMGRLLGALVEVYGATAQETSPTLTLEADPAADLGVLAIEGRLVQVFQNLIANAVSFSPPKGSIRIVAVRIASHVRISVEDDGPGIPEGKAEAIFDRFYSERPVAESFGTHSGLGLSISRQIVVAHNGQIRAENRVSQDGSVLGARFTVTLPAAPRKTGA